MTTIDPAAAAVAAPAPATATASGLGGMGSDAFLQLMIAQLRYQSPLSPSDPSAMMQQTAQFAQMELLQQVATVQARLLTMQQTGFAADLVGSEVRGTGPDGAPVEGRVDGVRFTTGGPVLRIGATELALDDTVELLG